MSDSIWTGEFPVPAEGTRLWSPRLGTCTARDKVEIDGFVGVNVKLEAPPYWLERQELEAKRNLSEIVDVLFGAELEPYKAPAGRLGFGLHRALPSGCKAAWGARVVWPTASSGRLHLLGDRCDSFGEHVEIRKITDAINEVWNTAVHDKWKRAVQRGLEFRHDCPVNLTQLSYGEHGLRVVANPLASCGHIYLAAWIE